MSQAHILVVDDEPDIRELVREILEDEGYAVDTAENGEAARARWAEGPPDLVLLDVWMPDMDGISLLREWSTGGRVPCPVVMISGHGTLDTAVEATRLGAHDFVQKPLSLAKLLATVRKALEAGAGADAEAPGTAARDDDEADVRPVGNSAEMQLLRQKAEQAAGHDSPMLITGEAGSGRETLARHVHRLGRHAGRFVALDHGRLDAGEARAYLFGRDGALERAAGGTLYLGDVHKIPGETQELLLQVIESGHWVREGGETRALDCRVIASAAPNVSDLVASGRIVDDLYFRLNVLPLAVPALRERPEDVPDLVRYYADWFPDQEDLPYRSFSVSAQNRLRNHSWPGNIRELRNLVKRLLILGGSDDVSVAEVEEALRQNAELPDAGGVSNPAFDLPLREAREQFEREYLLYQLRKAGGSVGKLSETAGMERTHLYRKLRALGIDPRAVAKESNNP